MDRDRYLRFHDRLTASGLFLDFDGTLSEIVTRPEDARPVEGVRPLLAALAERLRLVAIVSGRSAHQLVEWLGPDVEIWGVHGAEVARDGVVTLSEEAALSLPVMDKAKAELQRGIADLDAPGVFFEDKGVVANAHYRNAADPEAVRIALSSIVTRIADTYDLDVGRGRMTLELKPKVALSKANVVRQRATEAALEAAAFVGDDTVDLPAFEALDALEAAGTATLRVAVRSDEADPELLERADLIVDGPPGVVSFLEELIR